MITQTASFLCTTFLVALSGKQHLKCCSLCEAQFKTIADLRTHTLEAHQDVDMEAIIDDLNNTAAEEEEEEDEEEGTDEDQKPVVSRLLIIVMMQHCRFPDAFIDDCFSLRSYFYVLKYVS
jgi:hypothetical protein